MPNLMIFAILCIKMLPEGILSRLAKKTPNLFLLRRGIDTFWANLALTVQGAADNGPQHDHVISLSPVVLSQASIASV